MNFINSFLHKSEVIKSNKKLILIVILGFTFIALIFISELNFDNAETENNNIINDMTNEEYCEYLEEKVTDIIKCIEGAGETKVMITLSETTEYIYATNDKNVKKSNNSSDDNTMENDYVIIDIDNNDAGLLIKTIEPKVRGVAIVCEGGNNSTVQNQIYSAISAVLNVSTSRISISKLTHMEE